MSSSARRSTPERGWLPLHPTHYERLGLPEDADSTAIGDTLSRALAKATPLALAQSPDAQVPQTELEWQLACDVLADPLRREAYDRYLARERGLESARPRSPRVLGLVLVVVIGLLWAAVAWQRSPAASATPAVPGGMNPAASSAPSAPSAPSAASAAQAASG
jgi:hypothetical protein